ncbi:ABC transporter ATP-binding protein [Natronincola peptidivorans]|uniref:ABC transporter ATP-binding protein n=1 Tax=Natronincola peptidivorans TaxID=426128 RepID=UPI000B87918C|nr:ABC transporter ATP-binding protein [Natronincola peptidivorans]
MEIQVKNLHKNYGELEVIKNFNMMISPNKIHCIFGPSGCGKTTFINIVASLIPADEGNIEGMQEKTVSYIFQEDRLLPWATVEENILFVLESRYDEKEAQQLADKYLSLVDLTNFKNAYPRELSGGMKQRTAIARAFAYEGDVLVMDEPFKGLHLELKKDLMEYIINYGYRENRFFLFITHDVDEALYIADHIHIFQGPPLSLKQEIIVDIPHEERRSQKEKLRQYKEILLQRSKE